MQMCFLYNLVSTLRLKEVSYKEKVNHTNILIRQVSFNNIPESVESWYFSLLYSLCTALLHFSSLLQQHKRLFIVQQKHQNASMKYWWIIF